MLIGRRHPRPTDIAAASDADLRAAGLSRQKISYLRDLAQHSARGLPLARLRRLDDDRLTEPFTQAKPIRASTAQMYLMFRLGRLDVLPVDDYGIRKGMQKIYRMRSLPKADRMQKVAKSWRPYRSIACWYLWRVVDSKIELPD